MCKCHQPTEQCRPANKKIDEKAMKEHGFATAKHETLHLLQWTQKKIPNKIMGCNPLPTMGATKEVDFHGV
jgi:hypothetical protein